MTHTNFDIIIIGGGIVGLATALQLLQKNPHLQLLLLEKENSIALHQTGNNSGVIHSGIYYRPGSLKAKNCLKGAQQLLHFCGEHDISINTCGKVIVATGEEELPRLQELERRGKANGVLGLEMIGPERLREIEPAAAGLQALYSPNTAIIDFKQVAQAYAKIISSLGGSIQLNSRVIGICEKDDSVVVQTEDHEYQAKRLINCAGLYADRLAEMAIGKTLAYRICPFRGEYYTLKPEAHSLVRGLIYPVPDPKFPFLGVHLTCMIDGNVEAGPNAVLALAREGYRKTDFCLADVWDQITFKGFWMIAKKYWRMGLSEQYRSFSKKAFLLALQRLVPELTMNDLAPGGAGVRAQLVDRDGGLLDDFCIHTHGRGVHVLNAPSPAATSSLAIGEHIAGLGS